MSHVATGKLRVTSLDDLETAAARLGLTLQRGQTTFRWYGQFMNDSEEGRALARRLPASEWGKCQHALTVNGVADAYEVGVVPALDGGEGYDLVFDSWGPGRAIVERCGAGLERLAEEVGAEVAMRMMARKGYRVAREVNNTGHVQVVCTKAGA
jgi:hypothetical protein